MYHYVSYYLPGRPQIFIINIIFLPGDVLQNEPSALNIV